jgi:hypothetical protein
MKIHATTWREIHRIFRSAATAIRIPITISTVRGRKWTKRSRSACTDAASRGRRTVDSAAVSLRGRTVEQTATLPDGRSVTVHVGVPEDPYIPRRELETVDVELRVGGHVLAAVNTVLDPDQEAQALELAREIAHKLETGEIEPTAGAIEPFADTLR